MRILRASIENFRGIRQATIRFPSHALILGPNNACKSTVLEALNFALGPDRIRGADPVDEHDFFQGDYLYREHGADDLGEGETQLASDESQGSATDQVPSEAGDGPLPESAWPPAGSPRGCSRRTSASSPCSRISHSGRFLPTRIRLAACRAFTFRWPSPRNGLAFSTVWICSTSSSSLRAVFGPPLLGLAAIGRQWPDEPGKPRRHRKQLCAQKVRCP